MAVAAATEAKLALKGAPFTLLNTIFQAHDASHIYMPIVFRACSVCTSELVVKDAY